MFKLSLFKYPCMEGLKTQRGLAILYGDILKNL